MKIKIAWWIAVLMFGAATSSLVLVQAASTHFAQLTQSGCCVQPFFSQDSARVFFLDRPTSSTSSTSSALAGIYGVRVDRPLEKPELLTEKLGPFSRDMIYSAKLENGRTIVERSAGLGREAARWVIGNGGRSVSFSPNGARILWSVGESSGGFDRRKSDVWVANVDGSGARKVITRYGGGALAWLPDGERVLLGGRVQRGDALSMLSVLNLRDGMVRNLLEVGRLRAASLSPDGHRLIYYVAQARETGQGGTFLVDLNAAVPTAVRLDFFGAYRWRDATRLLYVPLAPGAPSNELWQYDAASGRSVQIIAVSADSPFRIAGGDWDVSPDGRRIVFLSARDRALWLAELP